MQNLFEKYGGVPTIAGVVRDFYGTVLDDPLLASSFENVELGALIDHQTEFLCQALGGPSDYSGRELAEAHQDMNISNAEFEAVLVHLAGALRRAGVDEEDIRATAELVESLRGQIVTRD